VAFSLQRSAEKADFVKTGQDFSKSLCGWRNGDLALRL
jgi:hypothetical protein